MIKSIIHRNPRPCGTDPAGQMSSGSRPAPPGHTAGGHTGESGPRRATPCGDNVRDGQKYTQYILFPKRETEGATLHYFMKKQKRKCS